MEHKERIRAQFGGAAAEYVTSSGHAEGADLDQITDWAKERPVHLALDVATGGGHTALALSRVCARVVASDLTERMLRAAEEFIRSQGVDNVEFVQADAEHLPFESSRFDLVSCRIAPHHFSDVAAFVGEVARVLVPGGIFLLEDSVVPEDPELDAFLNSVERVRDGTHVRSLRASEWRRTITDAGLMIEDGQAVDKLHELDSWLARAHTPEEARRRVMETFENAPDSARQAFRITLAEGGDVHSFTDQKLLIKARKRG